MSQITFGCDPEFFLREGKKIKCAHDMIPGTKDNPFKVKGGAIQVDGVAVEFNIDPVTNQKDFVEGVKGVMETLREMIPEKYDFNISSQAFFTPSQWERIPEDAKIVGCDPDFEAINGRRRIPPVSDRVRFAGGHLHIGWGDKFDVDDPSHIQVCRLMTRMLDLYVGLPLATMEPFTGRYNFYGKGSIFRPKSYGVEYRTPSNFWLTSEELMNFTFKKMNDCVQAMMQGDIPKGQLGSNAAGKSMTCAYLSTQLTYLYSLSSKARQHLDLGEPAKIFDDEDMEFITGTLEVKKPGLIKYFERDYGYSDKPARRVSYKK